MDFGEHIKTRRLELNLSLRAFCANHDEDPGDWSKLERGLIRPPEHLDRLLHIGECLEYERASPEMHRIFELANISRGKIPADILEDARLKDKLPLSFRMLRETPEEAELLRLADIVRDAHRSDA